MQEFEPKKRNKIITKEFLAKNAYIFVLAILLIGGITYGYTFFVQNKKIASGSITTAALTINFTDRSISASSLSVPNDDQEGLTEYSKSVTITNQTDIDGRVKLTLTRTSGLALTDMSYALVVNGAIQEIDDVPTSGEILETAIMGGSPTGETINVEIRLWPKTTYSGSETTFVGELTPEIKYLGQVAVDVSNLTGKYVNFNCNGSTCEEWQIVKVEDDRLVLTRQADYTNATSRTNSNRYDSTLSFNDNSLITSVSTDGKNVYLAKTVKITGGSGTIDDPYILSNNDYREEDKKVQAVITYKDTDGTTTIGTQNIYYNETNYISQTMNDSSFQYWDDGTNHYVLGDTITTITSDTNLTAYKEVNAVNLSFDNNITGFNCTDAQCALEELNNLIDPPVPICKRVTNVADLHTETCNNSSSSSYCQADGYALNGTITYGNAVALGTNKLTPGDAFDCDLTGDGVYNERFYYVSDYFDTNSADLSNPTFDSTYATLIYYRNFVSGAPSDSNGVAYSAFSENNYGPTVAVGALPVASANPTGNQWRNDLIKTQDRRILACDDGLCTTLSNMTANGTINTGNTPVYQGKAARLLTIKELVRSGCHTLSGKNELDIIGSLKECNFLMERTYYADSSLYHTLGIWLETPRTSSANKLWNVYSYYRSVSDAYSASSTSLGVRPVIDVPVRLLLK